MARKKVDDKEKISIVKIWVKKKYVTRAQLQCNKIEKKFR